MIITCNFTVSLDACDLIPLEMYLPNCIYSKLGEKCFLDLIWYSTWNNFNCKIIQFHLVAQMIKDLPAVWEIWIQSKVGTIP